MAEFKEILRFEKVDESGNVLQAEDIDLRRGIVGEEAPTENTPGMAGLLYYVVRDGKITAEYVCVAAEEGVYTWKKKKSGAVDDTLTVPGAAADAAIVGKKLTEQSAAISDKITAPSTVTVGQTIVVSEVDENGKPTKWEAIDMASGGTSDAVQYVPQELTEEQQMQARENLGLYRKMVELKDSASVTVVKNSETDAEIIGIKIYPMIHGGAWDEGDTIRVEIGTYVFEGTVSIDTIGYQEYGVFVDLRIPINTWANYYLRYAPLEGK